jgi:hypothetical protein
MGMFDHIYYKGAEYQTKDTPKQLCEYYAIEGGELWEQDYDAEWVEDDSYIFKGHLKQSNHHWIRCTDFTGSIRFYRGGIKQGWTEYRALIENGIVVSIEEINNR